MAIAQRYLHFSKEDFEIYLFENHNAFYLPLAFYKFNWQIIKATGEFVLRRKQIKEFVYAIKLNGVYCVLVYSGININDRESREAGKDAIRLVPVICTHLQPIRAKE